MTDPEETVILRGVTWDSGESSAAVCFPKELVVGGEDRVAALIMVKNRQSAVVLIDATGTEPRFSSALTVPTGVRVSFAPNGRALVLICEDDLYLPAESDFELNRGLLYLTMERVSWHDSVRAALERGQRDERWYTRTDDRYVPDGPIRVSCEWTGVCCNATIDSEDDGSVIVRFPQ